MAENEQKKTRNRNKRVTERFDIHYQKGFFYKKKKANVQATIFLSEIVALKRRFISNSQLSENEPGLEGS